MKVVFLMIVAVAALIYMLLNSVNATQDQCAAANGTLIRGYNGLVCVRSDIIIHFENVKELK